MLTLIIKVFRRACPRHRAFDPSRDGRGGVIGNCRACNSLCDVFEQSRALADAMREAEQITKRPRPTPQLKQFEDHQTSIFELLQEGSGEQSSSMEDGHARA